MKKYKRRWFKAGGTLQADLLCGKDIENLHLLDRKHFLVMSMPVKDVRFDRRTLAFLDSDKDGRIRIDEVLGAIAFLKSKNVGLDSLFSPSDGDRARLDEVMAKEADVAKIPPGEADMKALAEWKFTLESKEVSFLGEATSAAYEAFRAVEGIVDSYFTPAEDAPLVMDAPEAPLPLNERINPRFRERLSLMRELCVQPLFGEVREISRLEWTRLKAAFSKYADVLNARPVMNAGILSVLEEEEKILRYKLHLLEFLENFVNMKRLYAKEGKAIFQTGVLRIDAKELSLCFAVDSEAEHQSLSGKSNCCVAYVKIVRAADKAQRSICAVVTAGTISGLYVGRNGVFVDCDGSEWEARIVKVVESQVSLKEAFWLPWRKLGECVGSVVKKFFADKEAAGEKSLASGVRSVDAGGAALASSVAAIGIGVGMVGAAAASVMAAFASMEPWKLLASVVALVLVVSLPSVVLTWFKLRRRDLGAILNAGGWAINRSMGLSMSRARAFTRCAEGKKRG